MGKFTEYKLKKQADTNSATKYRQFREREIANQASQYIVEQLKNYENSNSKFIQSYKDRFFDSDGKYISDKYRRNTQVELLFANKEKEQLEKQRKELIGLLDSYGSNFKEDWLQETQKYLNDAGGAYEKIIKTYSDDNELFSEFKNADEFYDWSEKQKQKETLRNTDLASVKTEISDLTNALNNILSIEGQKSLLANQYDNLMYSSGQYPSAEGQTELNAIKAELDAFDKKQKELEGVFGSSSDLKKKLEELNKTYSSAKELQETEALTIDALNAPDFEKFAQKGSEWGNNTNFEFYGKDEGRGTYGFFNREKNDLISYYRNNLSSYENEAAHMANGPTKEMEKAYHFAKEMTEDEYNIYAYYLGKGDTDSAQKYLDSIEQSITYRFAENFYDKNLKDANYLEQIVFALTAGTEQFQTGLENLFLDSSEFAPSYRQVASEKVREELADDGFEVFGSSLGQVGYDLASTTGNMMPSILASTAVGLINPVAGQMVGSALMGASAKGNAYAEMINLGYNPEQASRYSTLVGASEAGLQFLLGGIGKLGGSVSSKAISSAVSKIDNVFARTAIQLGGNMFLEGSEEYLQEVLDPFFKNIAFGEDNDIRFISEDALYSGLLGALSAGVLEGGSTVGGNVSTYRTGKQLKAAGVTAEQLSELGSKLSINSEAYKLAGRINENTGAYTIGRMFNALNAEITAQNKAEIKEALRAKSINPVSANSIANWMERVVAGEELTAKQKAALENNPVLGEVMRDVLYERNTTALQRQAGLDSIRSQLEEYQIKQALDKAVKKAEKKKAKNTADAQDTQNTAQQADTEDFGAEIDTSLTESEKANEANTRVSDNGRTFSTKTGEDLNIVGIASVKDKTFKTADGQTVASKDVSFATENEAVLYDSVLSMDLPTEIANAIIDGYIPSHNISVTDYLLGSNLAYRYGYAGAKDIELMLDSDVRNIPEHLSKRLYNLGRETARAEISKEQAEIDSKKAQKSENKAKKKGSVTFDGKELSKEFEDSLTDIQRESIKGIKVIAEVLGNDVNLFASYEAKEGPYKGKRVYKDSNGNIKLAPNGFYNPDGSINLDINSGNLGEGTILYTLSHELTHHIRKWSPAKFKVLADFVVEQYSDNGTKINDLVYEQMAKAKKNGKSISYGTAYEEVIADACSTMLLDSNAIEKLAQKDKTLFEKIKSFIKDFIDKINKLYKNFSPDAKEAQYVKDIKGMTDKLQALWFEGLEDAGEAYSVVKEEKTFYKSKTSRHRYSFRDSESGMANDFLSPYNEELTHLIDERGDYIVDSFEKLEHIVNIAFDNPKHKATAYFGVVKAEKLNQIKNSINNMPKASKDILFKLGRDYSIATTLDSIRHIVDEKSLSRDDVVNYLDRFADTILEFDTVAYSTYVDSYGKKNVGLLFKKTFPDGMLVSFDLVSNKKRSIVLQTLYLNRADYQKKKSAETLLMPNASAHTPKARVGQTSKHSLPQDTESSQGKFSDRDSDGNTLSKEQQEFFKDSKVRDKDGNLLVMYHGTPNAGFTKFKSGTYFTQHKWYADRYQSQGASSLGVKKTADNPDTYAVYLNIKKPFDTRNKTERDIFYNEYYRQWGTGTDLMESGLPDWMDGMDLQEFLEENGYDYDGLILDEGGVGGYGEEVKSRGLSYITFSSEQVKNIDNKTPTSDTDIRFSDRNSVDSLLDRRTSIQSKINELRKTRKELESSDEYHNLISNVLSAETETEKTKSINEYNSWMAKTKYDEIVNEIKSLQKEYSEINRIISERVKQKAIEDERKKIAESGLSDADYFRKSAIKEFGYTPYFYDAGYMLPNGKLLNFSGEKGKHFGSRGQDHRAIETVYADVSRGKAMLKFMSEGNIRVMAETPGLDISSVAEPTFEQYTVVKKFVREYAKEKYLAVDITDENGNVIGTYEYENNINADRVVNDIKYYFQNGAIREQSSVSRFLYSDRDPDSFEARQEVQKQLVKENAILKEDNILLKELVALQRKVTNGTVLKKSSVDAVSKKIMKQLNVKGNTQELSKLLSDVYSYILRGTEVTWEDITEKAQPAINWIYENMQTEKVVDEYTLGVLREIRKSRVSLDETQKAEINAVLGSYKDFQKYTLGKIIIAKDGLSMDSWWGEMNEKYPNIFDSDISSSDMPTALIGILDNLYNSLYEEVYNYQSEMTKQDVLTEIYDGYWDVSTLYTVADQNQKKINELKAKHKEKLSKVRSSHNKKIVELKNKHKQEIKEIKAALREKSLKKEQNIRTKYQESRQRSIEGREKTAMRHKIQRVIMELDGMLRHGTKEKNVKVGLQKVVADAVQAINADTVKLEALRKAYADIRYGKSEDVPAYYMEEAAQIEQKIDEVIDLVGDTPMSEMSLEQLNAVYNMYRMVLTTVRNVNKVFRENKLEDLRVNAEAVMAEESSLPKLKEERSKAMETVRKYMWNEMIPVYAFETLGSNTLKKFFWDTVEAQNVFARDVDEANTFAKNAREKHGYKDWDRSKIYEFTLEDGKVMRMNLEHMMSVYAYSKRKQAISHMTTGGFFFNDDATFRKKGGVISLISSQEEGYKVSAETLAKIKDKMSEVATGSIEYVDEMQSYLTDMGEKGNEVSRVIWGIDIFKEKVYFPLKSVKDFVFQTNQPTQETSLKNDGMTKETKPNASNPIVLDSFDDIWASHVNRMSQYHAFVIPIDNLNKVYNYGTWLGDSSKSVSTIIGSRHGKAANEYLTQFIQDLNGGISVKGASNPLMNMFGKFKKTAVAASTSTVVQQPTAILRATAMIDPKYFIGKPNVHMLKQYKQLKKYAPIAIIKEIGGFDAGAGRQATNWLNDDTKQGVDKALQKIDDISMLGAAWGDILGWCTIWDAVKREVKANNKGMDVNSKEFLNLAGKRFTEVIVYTQVYDSTLSRSGYMRSKHDSVKMLTAFMGEPTVSVNMMYNAILQAKRGGKGMKAKAVRTIGAVYLSTIAASAAASAIYALRDDDEDETYIEKFAEAWSDKMLGKYGLTGELNPLTQLPAVKDIISIFEGWDVERTDIAVIKDIKDAFDGLFSENKSTWRKIEDFSGAIASLFGLPVKNILRTGREMYNAVNAIFSDVEGGSFGEAFLRGITGEEKSKPNKLYDAIVNGDEEMLKILREGYDDDAAYETAVKKALRENDPRIKEAAEAGYNGDVAERVRIAKEIIAEGNFSQDIVVEAINAEVNAIKKELDSEEDETEDVEEKKSIYSTKDISTALEDGDATLAKEIIADIVSVKVENYMAKDEDLKQKEAEKKAKTSVKSSLSEYWKKLYVEAYNAKDSDEMRRIRFVLKDTGLYGTANDIISTCNNWVKESRKK